MRWVAGGEKVGGSGRTSRIVIGCMFELKSCSAAVGFRCAVVRFPVIHGQEVERLAAGGGKDRLAAGGGKDETAFVAHVVRQP
jgi:hypothetical protein